MSRQPLTLQNLAAWTNAPGQPQYRSSGRDTDAVVGVSPSVHTRPRQERSQNASNSFLTPNVVHVGREVIRQLGAKNLMLQEKIRQLEMMNQTLLQEKDALQKRVGHWVGSCHNTNMKVYSLQAELQMEKDEKQSARQEAIEIQRQLAEQAPLVEIGERVRLRFLEQERLTYSTDGITREQLDQQKIDQGNEAAHGGNGNADAALIYSLERRGIDVEGYKEMFLDMYRCITLESYHFIPLRWRKAQDISVSILAGTGMHAGLGTEQQRRETLNVINELECRYHSAGVFSEAAAQDQEIDRLLAQAEAMKAELVKSHNQRRNNRRGPRPRRRQDLGRSVEGDDWGGVD